jgi:hypothetical protein
MEVKRDANKLIASFACFEQITRVAQLKGEEFLC